VCLCVCVVCQAEIVCNETRMGKHEIDLIGPNVKLYYIAMNEWQLQYTKKHYKRSRNQAPVCRIPHICSLTTPSGVISVSCDAAFFRWNASDHVMGLQGGN
jgi:hypothetical protein